MALVSDKATYLLLTAHAVSSQAMASLSIHALVPLKHIHTASAPLRWVLKIQLRI